MTDLLVVAFVLLLIGGVLLATRRLAAKPVVSRLPVPVPAAESSKAVQAVAEPTDAEFAADESVPSALPDDAASASHRASLEALNAGDGAAAVALARAAWDAPAEGDAARRRRLAYGIHLGLTLGRTGALEEAERHLRQVVAEHDAVVGRLQPAYAVSLNALARVLMARGDFGGAVALTDEALAVLGAAEDDGLPFALGLSLAARAAAKAEPTGLSRVDDGTLSDVLAGLVEACDAMPTAATTGPLALAVSVLAERGKLASPAGAQLLSRLAQVQFAVRDFNGAGQAWEHFAQVGEASGQFDLWGIGLLNAAATRLEANRPTEALGLVEKLGARDADFTPPLRVRWRREHGLMLARLGRKEPALAALDDALGLARALGQAEHLGPALASAGIWRMHAGEGDVARGLLEEAAGLLPDEHPETPGVRGHLETLGANVPCPCAQRRLEQDFTRAVASALSPELVRVRATMQEGQLAFSMEFSRQPSTEEFEKAKGAFEAAMQRVNGGAPAAAEAV